VTLREREVTMRPGGDEKRYEAKAERLEVNAAAVMASQGRRPGTTVDWECAGDHTTPRHTTPHSAVQHHTTQQHTTHHTRPATPKSEGRGARGSELEGRPQLMDRGLSRREPK
jgi:hypothetical protein